MIDMHYVTNPRDSPLIEIEVGIEHNKKLYQVIFDLSVESGKCTLVPISDQMDDGDGDDQALTLVRR